MAIPATVRKRLILPTVGLSLMTVISAVAGLNVALPSLARETGASQTELTWIVDAYTVVFAGLLLLAGAIGDRFGRRITLTLGLMLYGIASTAGVLLSDPQGLIAVRMIMGVGAALIMPSTLSVITTSFEKEERAKAVSVWVGIAGGGAIVGIFGTAILLEYYEWNSFFILNLCLAITGFIMTLLFIPESTSGTNSPLDWRGGVLSVAGVGTLVMGIIQGPEHGWISIWTSGAIALGAIVLCLFIFHELRQEHPLIDPREFKNRAFSAGSLSVTIQFFCQFGFIFVGMQYLQYVARFSALEAALHLLPLPLFLGPSARIAAHLSKKFPQKILGTTGLAIFSVGLFTFSTLNTTFDYTRFLIALGFFGVGAAFATMPATTAITNSMPLEKQGVASAVNDTSRELGSALGIAILGSTLTNTYQTAMSDVVKHLPTQFADLVYRSAAFTQLTPPQGMEEKFAQLNALALQAFSDGSSNALRIAGAVALTGAVAIGFLAPRKLDA